MNLIVNIIQVTQLDTLGFTDEYRKLTIAFIMLFLTYFICKPLIRKLIEGKHIMFLTYVIVASFMTILALIIALINDQLNSIALVLQAIALFGLLLSTYLLYQLFKRIIKRNFKRYTS